MQADTFLPYGEFIYAAILVCVLAYALLYVRRKSNDAKVSNETGAVEVTERKPLADDLARSSTDDASSEKWWNHQDFPYSAPWWIRYPASITVFAGSYWAFFDWDQKAGWILGILFSIIGLGLIRELFVAILVSALAGLTLWALGAAIAALPVSAAIIIGAMIIAQAVRR